MKKIIIFSIGLLFSSVHAQAYSEADVAQAAAELVQNPALVEKCVQLLEQGLTLDQITEQMYESHGKQAHLSLSPKLFQVVFWGGMFAALFGLVLFRDHPDLAANIGEYLCSNSSLLSDTPLCLTGE